MLVTNTTIKTIGIAAGVLLFAYALALLKARRYDAVSDKYASAFSTVGLILILAATNGFLGGTISSVLEAGAYLLGAVGGTVAFVRIINHQKRFKRA